MSVETTSNECPICGDSLRRIASTNQEYCEPCNYIAVGSLIKVAFDYVAGPIMECKGPNGEPGFKSSYPGKCYIYTPGDEVTEKEARRRAYMQDYHKQRRKRITGSVKEGITDFDNFGVPELAGGAKDPTLPQTTADGATPLAGPTFMDFTNGLAAAYGTKNSDKEKENMSEIYDIERLAKEAAYRTDWFDGTSNSIYNRLELIQSIIGELKTASSSPNLNVNDLSRLSNVILTLESEQESLQKTASEYVDYDTELYLQSLPGGTVASVYRTTDFGTADLGEDDGSLLYRAAKSVESDYNNADWINFVTAGAENWVNEQIPRLLEDESNTRQAAVYFVEKKTLPILDIEKRAAIIDNFITNVEICRREKKANNAVSELKVSKTASRVLPTDDILGTTANWF